MQAAAMPLQFGQPAMPTYAFAAAQNQLGAVRDSNAADVIAMVQKVGTVATTFSAPMHQYVGAQVPEYPGYQQQQQAAPHYPWPGRFPPAPSYDAYGYPYPGMNSLQASAPRASNPIVLAAAAAQARNQAINKPAVRRQ